MTSLWPSRPPHLGTQNVLYHTISLLLTLAWLSGNSEKTVCSVFHLKNHSANYQLNVKLKPNVTVKFDLHPSYLGICLDRSLSFRTHLHTLKKKVLSRVALTKRLAGVGWGASFKALRTSCLALAFAPAEYCAPMWCRSAQTKHIDVPLNESMRVITGLRSTPSSSLPIRSGITPSETRRSASCLKLYTKALNPKHLLHETRYLKPSKRLRSRNLYAPSWNCCQLTGNQPHQSMQLSNASFLHSAHNHQVATSPEMPGCSSTAWGPVLADLRPTWN